jgi:membrane associated rhomboid family serine protease
VLPRFRRGAFALFALVFLVTMLLGDRASLADALTLEPGAVLGGRRWWTPLTTMFRYPEGLGMLGLVWTLLIQWGIGSRLEGFWGTARYLAMVLVAALLGYAGALALALVVPAVQAVGLAGAAPIDAAAVTAFGFVFARERMKIGSRELSPVLLAGITGALVVGFPMLAAVVAGRPAGEAWPTLIPALLAALVAVGFVQPWRRRENSGKVGRAPKRNHLRVVRTPEDMLN